jgi:hypothetical protein
MEDPVSVGAGLQSSPEAGSSMSLADKMHLKHQSCNWPRMTSSIEGIGFENSESQICVGKSIFSADTRQTADSNYRGELSTLGK